MPRNKDISWFPMSRKSWPRCSGSQPGPATPEPLPQQWLVPAALGVHSPGASPAAQGRAHCSQVGRRGSALRTHPDGSAALSHCYLPQWLSGLTDHFLSTALIEICTINNLPNWVEEALSPFPFTAQATRLICYIAAGWALEGLGGGEREGSGLWMWPLQGVLAGGAPVPGGSEISREEVSSTCLPT